MITEDYVSFEVSKLLKEKGFDEICRAVYVIRDERLVHCTRHNIFDFTNNERIKEVGDGDTVILAPTLQMAMKWLRKKYNIHIEPRYFPMPNIYRYVIIHSPTTIENIDSHPQYFNTYEEVCEAAIRYCLENLI